MKVTPISLGTTSCFLLSGELGGLVLVDGGNPGDGLKVKQAIEEVGYRTSDLTLVVVTHGHSDHVGGLAELEPYHSAKTVVGREDVKALTEGEGAPVVPAGPIGRLLKRILPERDFAPLSEEPARMDEESLSLRAFGIDGEIIHLPGHTNGSLGVVSKKGPAVVGDLIMGRYVIFGRPRLPVFAEAPDAVEESIRKVLEREPRVIYTSHGGPYKPESLERLLN